MNSNKQKKKQLKAKRKQKAEKNRVKNLNHLAYGRVWADHSQLTHINSYGGLPDYYEGKDFTCRDCGVDDMWTANQQKFYFEECKGHIDSLAVRCNACRNILKLAKKEQQAHMQEMKDIEIHPNELFFKDLDKFKVST